MTTRRRCLTCSPSMPRNDPERVGHRPGSIPARAEQPLLLTMKKTPSAADEEWNLHRHWRNARTHTLHDPEVWKYQYIGDFVLNGRKPPPLQALIV